MKPLAIIPARYASTRFPGKPLALVAGKPMVEQVYRRCEESGVFSRVWVATDDARIAEVVRGFGGEVRMTSEHCQSGTDRVAEVAAQEPLDDEAVLVNVQGDEPALHPDTLIELVKAFEEPTVQMATLVRPLEPSECTNPNVVKAVLALDGRALYFSRADLPFQREPSASPPRYAHLGIYGYRKKTVLQLAALPPSPLERAESLEQLRALENGIPILCRLTHHRTAAVDRPEDVKAAEALLSTLLP